MFDLSRQIKLKQAKSALRDGRLDEAFAIATTREIRELRGGQALLAKLVKPLLKRAETHRTAERWKDALLDAERAIAAGGQVPQALELREEAQQALGEKRRDARKREEALASARRHIEGGHIDTGLARLDDTPEDDEDAPDLRRRAEHRARHGDDAVRRAAEHLERGEIIEALNAMEVALRSVARSADLDDLLHRVKGTAVSRIEAFLNDGNVASADRLLRRLERCAGTDSLECQRLHSALDVILRSGGYFQRKDYEGLQVELGRLRQLLPEAAWVRDELENIGRVCDILRGLRSGPIGIVASTHDAASPATAPTMAERVAPAVLEAPQRPATHESRQPLLLWVDGVGTYLLLPGSRTTIGRTGSSASPQIALSGDLAGYHAEILRIDDDYFIVAGQGSVHVDGQPTKRKLLADGDDIKLSDRCHVTFKLPTALSGSAVLSLRGGQRLDADVQDIILLSEHFMLGPKTTCHVRTPGEGEPVVLSCRDGEVACRAKEDVMVDGKPMGRNADIPLGQTVQIGNLTFTLTAASRGKEA